jgi:hypothetical protein
MFMLFHTLLTGISRQAYWGSFTFDVHNLFLQFCDTFIQKNSCFMKILRQGEVWKSHFLVNVIYERPLTDFIEKSTFQIHVIVNNESATKQTFLSKETISKWICIIDTTGYTYKGTKLTHFSDCHIYLE